MDISLVIITIIYSLIASNKLYGVGLGTIAAMILIGRFIHLFDKILSK